jgi:hypothetical protein
MAAGPIEESSLPTGVAVWSDDGVWACSTESVTNRLRQAIVKIEVRARLASFLRKRRLNETIDIIENQLLMRVSL